MTTKGAGGMNRRDFLKRAGLASAGVATLAVVGGGVGAARPRYTYFAEYRVRRVAKPIYHEGGGFSTIHEARFFTTYGRRNETTGAIEYSEEVPGVPSGSLIGSGLPKMDFIEVKAR